VGQADLIIVMEKGQKEAVQLEFLPARERVFLLTELAGPVAYDIPDPAFSLEDPFKLIHEIIGLIEKGFTKIVSLAETFAANRVN
jgi:protein-tyrosine-phosphatase